MPNAPESNFQVNDKKEAAVSFPIVFSKEIVILTVGLVLFFIIINGFKAHILRCRD